MPRDHLSVVGAHQTSRAEDLVYALQSVRPQAAILPAGGNDVKGGTVSLLGSALASPSGIDTTAVHRYVTEAFAQPYRDLVSIITAKAERMGQPVPIIIHGYDYPRVSERARWLAAQVGHGAAQLLEGIGRAFVDAFDSVLSELADEHPGIVFLADVRGTLTSGEDWADEIHPSARGFAKLAEKIDGLVRKAATD